MAKLTRIRDNGVIPEKRHDAFLLALLLALALNVAFFAVQALIPKVASLLRLLAPEPSIAQQEPEIFPFMLVDPSLLDEEIDPDIPPDAESDRSREARDTEAHPDLPEDKPHQEEGVDEILTFPAGNPGPVDTSAVETPGDPSLEAGAPGADTAQESPRDERMDEGAERQPDDSSDTDAPSEPAAETPPVETVPETPEPPPPLVDPPPEVPEITEVPQAPEMEEVPEPEAPKEPLEAPEAPEEPAQAPEIVPEPVEEMPELAFLPVTPDGFLVPPASRIEDKILRPPPPTAAPPQQRNESHHVMPYPRPQPEMPVHNQPEANPRRPRSSRQGESHVPFRELGNRGQSGGSVSGGTPPLRNQNRAVNLLDADPNMRILAHRYGEYMRKVAEQLQQSLNRVIWMNPSYYSRGQGKIQFSIAADGSLAFSETVYPIDGSNEVVRIISETTVREAAPFDRPTQQMLEDPLFSKMSLTVNLY